MRLFRAFLPLLTALAATAQQPAAQPDAKKFSADRGVVPQTSASSLATTEQDGSVAQADYILGPGDQIVVRAVNVEEITPTPIVIDMSGYVRLPVAGRIKVGGQTVAQVETELATKLKSHVLKPDVSVLVTEFHSQPVSVIGSVKTPGIQQVRGRKTLVEILSMAGGVDPTAGTTLKITRDKDWGRIPLSNAVDDKTGRYSIAEVNLQSIINAKSPESNIFVKPNDVISVPRADTVYVMGQVQKAGGFVLNDRETVTVLQALSMAGGFDKTARPQDALIMRRSADGQPTTDIPVDLRKILQRKSEDIRMQPDDILYVPDNVPKKAALRTLEAAIQMGTGIVIFRRP